MIESQPTPPTKEKRFAYKLYLDILAIMTDVADRVEIKGRKPLYENRFIKMIMADEKVKSTLAKHRLEGANNLHINNFIAAKIKESALFKSYLKEEGENMANDLKVWVDIFNAIIVSDNSLLREFENIENYTLRGVDRMKEMMQTTFSNFSSSQGHISDAIKTLRQSLEKAHELYFWLLLLPVELTNLREQQIEINRNKFITTNEDINPNLRFVENALVERLRQSEQLNNVVESKKIAWLPNDRILINKLLKSIMESDIYNDYMNAPQTDVHADCEFWRSVFKHIVLSDQDLIEALEEKSVFWNDDLDIIGTFTLKTFKRFEDNPSDAIMAMYKDEEDSLFGEELFRATVKNKEEYRQLIDTFVKKESWDSERLAFMDVVITLTAIAEMLNFPKIPLKVTINEYIEMAKAYSTPKSSSFINGILASIINNLKQQGRLLKND
jgi:N utilization substance protein B